VSWRPEKDSPETRAAAMAEAEAQAESARAHIRAILDATDAAYKDFPLAVLAGSKAQREKARSPNGMLDRLRVVTSKPSLLRSQFEHADKVAERKAKEAEEQLAKQKEIDAQKTLEVEAALWLTQRGKVLGQDFDGANALAMANEIAFEEAVAAMLRDRKDGEYFEFSGSDYCEDCPGWDGSEHRCECGNRRVSWEKGWGFSFKNPTIHAEAY